MYGYMGNVLRVNLTQGTTEIEALNMEDAKNYIGSRGLGVKTYMDEVDPKVEALSEENKVMIATAPLTGTFAPTGGRYMVITKSPLMKELELLTLVAILVHSLKKLVLIWLLLRVKL